MTRKTPGWFDRRCEWAAQTLLAVKTTPDMVPEADRKVLDRLAGQRPTDEAGWRAMVGIEGSPDAGRRVFFHANAARCFTCHTVDNRGGSVGPDLSHVGVAMTRQKLIESVLDPSREIAPLYVPVVLELRDGTTVTGVGLEDSGADSVQFRDATGKLVKVKADQIVSRRAEKISLMPANLVDGLTVEEFRDLLAFLESRK